MWLNSHLEHGKKLSIISHCAVCLVTQSSETLRPQRTVACQEPLSTGTLQARILEWVAMPSSRGSSQPRDWIQVSSIAWRLFTIWVTRKALISHSVQFSRSVVSDSLWPHESQHTRPPCPSPTSRVHSNSCPSRWCHPAISSSVVPLSSCP